MVKQPHDPSEETPEQQYHVELPLHIQAMLQPFDGGEPCFVLRANDVLAPATVRDWCVRAAANGVDGAKIQAAHKVAAAMDEHQRKNGSKLPD